MKNNMDRLLKTALTPMNEPDEELNDQILWKAKERRIMAGKKKSYQRRIPAAALVAACTLLLCSGTALAVYKYLSPAEVATQLEDNTLQTAFLSEDAIQVNETQESGGYRVTLLGSVSGKNISDFVPLEDGEESGTEADKIYTVVAIEHADGTPMPDTSSGQYDEEVFYVSHYIHGLDPNKYSLMSLGGGYSAFVKNGIHYRLLEMDNIDMFADRGIYVGVSGGTFYDAEAYHYDESTGEISRNENYGGVNALFKLPVDPSKADPAAAEAYLKNFEESLNTPDEPIEKDAVDIKVEEFMAKLTPENLDEYAEPIESTRQICQIEELEGWGPCVDYSYECEYGSGSGKGFTDSLFPDGKPGICSRFDYSYTDEGLDGLIINVFILNEDGTVTFVLYRPK